MGRGGAKVKSFLGLLQGKNDFCVFSKTDSLARCAVVGGKLKKYQKTLTIIELDLHHKTLPYVVNRFRVGLGVERTCFNHYFDIFGYFLRFPHSIAHLLKLSVFEKTQKSFSQQHRPVFPSNFAPRGSDKKVQKVMKSIVKALNLH